MWRGGDVVQVPAEFKNELLRKAPSALLEAEDRRTWIAPDDEILQFLFELLSSRDDALFPRTGTRLGSNSEGIFIHEAHQRRFFGLPRSVCSELLLRRVPEAAASFNNKRAVEGESTFDRYTRKMGVSIEEGISDSIRHQVLTTVFTIADSDKNGWLSKNELSRYLRRVLYWLKGRDVEDMFDEADLNSDGKIRYDEFVTWLAQKASGKVVNAIQTCMRGESDIVRTTFRAFDQNGDGLITKKELAKVFRTICPSIGADQAEVIISLMDKDRNQMIDYNEFVDFLFVAD